MKSENKAAVWFPISSSWTKGLARLLLLIAPVVASSSHANLMSVDATGVVIQANPSLNPAHVGDTITLHGIFDSASLVDKSAVFGIPGLQFGSFAFGPNDALTIDMPGQHWSLTDEPLFGAPINGVKIPHIVLPSGAFYGLISSG